MRNKVLMGLISWVTLCTNGVLAGGNVTYDFEDIGNGNSSFVSSGQTFTVIPELIGINIATFGSDLNGNQLTSDGYLDTGFEQPTSGNVGGINAPSGMTFRAQRFDVWPSTNGGGVVQAAGTLVRVLGFRDGQSIISADVAMTDYGQNTAQNVRWHRIDLSGTAFASTDIDSVQFELLGDQNYIAVDNFIYSDLMVANALPVISGTVAGQMVNDDQTLLPFSGVVLSEPDGQNISLTISLDNDAKGVFTPASLGASGFSGSGPYVLSSMSATNAQAAIRLLEFNPTDDRVAPGLTETTIFNIASSDGVGTSNDNTTSVISTSVDQDPLAVADSYTLLEDAANTALDVLQNDTDVDAGPKTVMAVSQSVNGTVQNNTVNLSYQPDPDYCNDGVITDDFSYTLNGGSVGDVAMNITCVNDPPSFNVMGDVDATGLIDAQNTEIQIDNFAENMVFGPPNEAGQGVLGFFPNCTDPDGVINLIVVNAQGRLTIDFTLNLGVADCDLVLLDNGGTSNSGNNTSATESFTVAYTDVIFANGFDGAMNLISQLNEWLKQQATTDQAELLVWDEHAQLLWFKGHSLQLADIHLLSSRLTLLKSWLRLLLNEV